MTASFGRILPNALLQLFAPGRKLNVHPSLLPLYRGPAPIQHALLDGQSETGVCVIEMMEKRKGIDAGEVWARETMVSFRPPSLYCRRFDEGIFVFFCRMCRRTRRLRR